MVLFYQINVLKKTYNVKKMSCYEKKKQSNIIFLFVVSILILS